jgi:hypothetical protein
MALSGTASAFPVSHSTTTASSSRPSTQLYQGDGTGGWGIGASRKLTPEEFAKGERSYFEGYKTLGRGDFIRQIEESKDAQKQAELDELLGVASIAGIKVKDPKERLDQFDMEDDEDDELDLSI